jgi:hypothetical protein
MISTTRHNRSSVNRTTMKKGKQYKRRYTKGTLRKYVFCPAINHRQASNAESNGKARKNSCTPAFRLLDLPQLISNKIEF